MFGRWLAAALVLGASAALAQDATTDEAKKKADAAAKQAAEDAKKKLPGGLGGLFGGSADETKKNAEAAAAKKAEEAKKQVEAEAGKTAGAAAKTAGDAGLPAAGLDELSKEQEKHAQRTAKLDRIEAIAGETGDAKLLERVKKAREKENRRHEKKLGKLKDATGLGKGEEKK